MFAQLRYFSVAACVIVPSVFPADPSGVESYVYRDDTPLYRDFDEADFPFAEVTLDLRAFPLNGKPDNLVPRGLLLRLSGGVYACFDTELLRLVAIWDGDRVTPEGLALQSYGAPLKKAPPGQGKLSAPAAEPWVVTNLYPGWQSVGSERFEDPRPRWVDEAELGRGPLARSAGRWLGVEDTGEGPVLLYSVGEAMVREHYRCSVEASGYTVTRSIEVEGDLADWSVVALEQPDAQSPEGASGFASGFAKRENRYAMLDVTGEGVRTFGIRYTVGREGERRVSRAEVAGIPDAMSAPVARWEEAQPARFEAAKRFDAYQVEELTLPYPNLWKRRVRPADIEFLAPGVAAVVTFDGDVYIVSGLGQSDDAVAWRRIAAGLNEPQSIAERDGELFVFSRGGVTRLVDLDGDGETDFYSMFCNDFTQSADTRDLPLSLVAMGDGSFLIAKGGQQVDALSPHSGRALRIAADGRAVDYYAYGFRNAYLARHPSRSLVTASDQQGNWVPATPLIVVEEGEFYGYELGQADRSKPTREAELWIPHRVAHSGIGQVWAMDDRLGPLEGSLLYIDYYAPRLLRTYGEERDFQGQAGVTPLPLEFETPLLNGALNPADGALYFVGFQIWGSRAKRLEGLCRVTYVGGRDEVPIEVEAFKEGVLLRFAQPVPEAVASDAGKFELKSWQYKRTPEYGSPHYTKDGAFGEDSLFVHSILRSTDGRSVFVASSEMAKTMQLQVDYAIGGDWRESFLTISEQLRPFEPSERGFQSVSFAKLFASQAQERSVRERYESVSASRGRKVFEQYGCAACHSTDGTTAGKSGPSLANIYWQPRTLTTGEMVVANDEYIAVSIMRPERHIVEGFGGDDASMPSYRGILDGDELRSVILYLKTLQSPE